MPATRILLAMALRSLRRTGWDWLDCIKIGVYLTRKDMTFRQLAYICRYVKYEQLYIHTRVSIFMIHHVMLFTPLTRRLHSGSEGAGKHVSMPPRVRHFAFSFEAATAVAAPISALWLQALSKRLVRLFVCPLASSQSSAPGPL